MSAINVNSITGRTGTHGPVLTGVTTATNGLNVTGGSVGVGTDGPGSLVDIASGDLEFSNKANSSAIQTINFSDGTQGRGKIQYQHDGDNLTFHTFSDERIRINANGDLGINTTGGSYTVQMHEPSTGSFTLQLTTGAIGSASTSGARITASASRKLYIENQENEDTLFYNNGGEKLVIKSGGNVNITNGNLVVASGHGIDFSATGDATGATSELLDDYEEGTWTPRFQGTTGTSGDTYSTQVGYYIKVGNKITVAFTLNLTAKGSRSGSLVIGGLPYTASSQPNSGAGNISYFTDVTPALSFISCNSSTSSNRFFVNYAAASTTAMVNDPAILTNNTRMDGIFTYFTI